MFLTIRLWTTFLLLLLSVNSYATLITFTDPALFNDAIVSAGATSGVVDFDNAASGTVIPNNSSFGGINFSFTDDGGSSFDGIIADAFDTTSGSNYLGFNAQGATALLSGDVISMIFSQTYHALGLYIIASPGDFGFADDAILSAGNAMAANGAIPDQTLGDGGEAFFIGLIDSDGFTSAELATVCCGFFEFNIDDISLASFPAVTATPQQVSSPATLVLMMLAMMTMPLATGRAKQTR